MSRRGVATLSLEYFVALIVAIAVLVIMLVYVESSLEASGLFRDLYAKDLSMLSDVVSTSPGELLVTYDNFKRGMGLAYFFDEGEVKVSIRDEFPKTGVFSLYEDLDITSSSFEEPSFLSFVKTGDKFLVSDTSGYLSGCSRVEKTQDPIVVLRGPGLELVREGFREATTNRDEILVPLEESPEQANLIFNIVLLEQTSGTIQLEHTNTRVAEYVACILEGSLQAYGLETTRQEVGGEFDGLVIRVSQEDVSLRLLGQMLGRSVVVYAR